MDPLSRLFTWLEDRVRLNRIRTRQGMLDIEIQDDTQVQKKRRQLRRDQPMEAGIYVHGPGELTKFHNLQLRADDAEADGRALRLALAAGSGNALHYFGEGGEVNFATAKEMGEPTARFYAERQDDMVNVLENIITTAYHRFLLATGHRPPSRGDLKLNAAVPEVARADNQSLALASKDIVIALAEMRAQGWIDDATAIQWAFKFAGETIETEDLQNILDQPPQPIPQGDQE